LDRQPGNRAMRTLWLIIAIYFVCAGVAGWLMPWSSHDQRWPEHLCSKYTPPDEYAHLAYVKYLFTHRALPLFDDPTGNYEAHQPPLYYASCLPAYAVGSAMAESLGLADPDTGALLLIRVWSILIGGAVIWAVYLLGLRLFGNDHRKALMAAGFAGFLPMHLVNLAGITNDGLAELMVVLATLAACRLAAEPSDRSALMMGIWSSLAILVKSNSLFLLVVGMVAALLATRKCRDESVRLKVTGRYVGIFLGTIFVLCGWWWIRNQMLYGDPLAQKVFVELFSIDRATPEWFFERGISGIGYLQMIAFGTALSFWGVFGQANVYMPEYFYLLGWGFTLAVIVGLVRSVRSEQKFWVGAAACWLLVILSLGFVAAFYLRFNMIFYQVQARYLFTGIGPLAALFVAGWWGLWSPGGAEEPGVRCRYGWVLWWVILGLLVGIAVYHLRSGAPCLVVPFVGG
jgi:hypothetical protein